MHTHTFGMAPDAPPPLLRSCFGDGLRETRFIGGTRLVLAPPLGVDVEDDDDPDDDGVPGTMLASIWRLWWWKDCFGFGWPGVDVYGRKFVCCPDMIGICRMALHAMHEVADSEFFNVHWAHDQNSPFRRVISSTDDILFNLDPPQTTHALTRGELTSVHFLHVHSSPVVWPTVDNGSTINSSSSKSCSNDAIGTSTIDGTSSNACVDLDEMNLSFLLSFRVSVDAKTQQEYLVIKYNVHKVVSMRTKQTCRRYRRRYGRFVFGDRY